MKKSKLRKSLCNCQNVNSYMEFFISMWNKPIPCENARLQTQISCLFEPLFVPTWWNSYLLYTCRKPLTCENVQFRCDIIFFSHVEIWVCVWKIANHMLKYSIKIWFFFLEGCKQSKQQHSHILLWRNIDLSLHVRSLQLKINRSILRFLSSVSYKWICL